MSGNLVNSLYLCKNVADSAATYAQVKIHILYILLIKWFNLYHSLSLFSTRQTHGIFLI